MFGMSRPVARRSCRQSALRDVILALDAGQHVPLNVQSGNNHLVTSDPQPGARDVDVEGGERLIPAHRTLASQSC